MAEIDWSRNIGKLVLDVEAGLFGDWVLASTRRMSRVEDGYRLLDELLLEARTRLHGELGDSQEEQVLSAIHQLLLDRGFTYKDYEAQSTRLLGHHTLSFGLARLELDCSMYTVLYLAIAEELGLPLSGISMPEHLAVRWTRADGSYSNWETTMGLPATDAFYRKWKQMEPPFDRPQVYLRSLSKAEVLATAYGEKALVLSNRGQGGGASQAVRCAVQLAPGSPDAFNLRGVVARKQGELQLALQSFGVAIALDPRFAHAHFNLGQCALELGIRRTALESLAQLEALDPSLAQRLLIAIDGQLVAPR